MKTLWDKIQPWHRWVLSAVAGLLLALSFPVAGIAGLAWVAPGLILLATLGCPRAEVWRLGYVAGLVHYLVSLSWLLNIPYRWHSIPLGPAAGWFALSAFIAIYPATWAWLSAPRNRGGEWLDGPLAPRWSSRAVWCLAGAVIWVGWEMIVARFLTGFPWNLLGSSQFRMIPLIQIASVTGIYGVSFLAVWFSLALLCAVAGLVARPGRRGVWIAELILPLVVLAVVVNFGMRRAMASTGARRSITVALVQPSIPQTLIWDQSRDAERFADLLEITRQAATNQVELLLWPEAAVPKLLRYYEEMVEPVSAIARSNHCWMVLGADDMEAPPGSTKAEDQIYFNASFLVNPDGKLVERYCKRRLVIFGEYIPLARSLPFLKWFTPIQGGFTPGKSPGLFRIPSLKLNLTPLICFEDIFPHLVRDSISEETDLLVNLTNNGWFGEGSAQWQHASGAVFRAIENGIPLVRCSNNGITCWVDSQGRMREIFYDAQGSPYGPGYLRTKIELPLSDAPRETTFYRRYGDWFGWICVALTALLLARQMKRPTVPPPTAAPAAAN